MPDFKLGLPQQEWEKKKTTLKNDNTGSYYNWIIGDTAIETRISLNCDGINSGPLRLVSLNLLPNNGEKDKSCTGLIEKILKKLERSIGQPDSVKYEFGIKPNDINPDTTDIRRIAEEYLRRRNEGKYISEGRANENSDTLAWEYYFHEGNSAIVLRKGNYDRDNNPTYLFANLYVISKSYQQELSSVIQEARKNLKARDFIKVPVYTRVENETKEFGLEEKRLYLTAVVDDPIKQRISLAEPKAIKAIKGHIVIYDGFGDSLISYPDVKIELIQPMPNALEPGLTFAMGKEEVLGPMFIETKKTVFIRVNHPQIPSKLRNAVLSGEKLDAKFIADAVVFEDGSVLK